MDFRVRGLAAFQNGVLPDSPNFMDFRGRGLAAFANGILPLKKPLLDPIWLPSSISSIHRIPWISEVGGWRRFKPDACPSPISLIFRVPWISGSGCGGVLKRSPAHEETCIRSQLVAIIDFVDPSNSTDFRGRGVGGVSNFGQSQLAAIIDFIKSAIDSTMLVGWLSGWLADWLSG